MKISNTLLILLTFCFISCCYSININNYIQQESIIEDSHLTYLLIPYQDSECQNVGNGIGAGLTWDSFNMTGNYVPYYFPYTSHHNVVCLNISSSDESTFSFMYRTGNCIMYAKYITTEEFELSTCKYSNFLKGYYKLTKYEPLPEGTIILPTYGPGNDNEPCGYRIRGIFNFIFNGTTINTPKSTTTASESFYCNINNELPYQKTCYSDGTCHTEGLYNTCDNTDNFRFFCAGGPTYSSDNSF